MVKKSEIKDIKEVRINKEQSEQSADVEIAKTQPDLLQEQKQLEEKQINQPQEHPSTIPMQQAQVMQKNKVILGIEHILSENLADAYTSMSPEKRIAFKKRGEEIAEKVKVMVDKGKMHAHKILKWIRDWLRMIPGVNVFFLEQEAKIKADKLMEYYKKQTGK